MHRVIAVDLPEFDVGVLSLTLATPTVAVIAEQQIYFILDESNSFFF
jgi:hypothetical protein